MKEVYKPVKEIVKKDPSERTPEEQELMDEVGTIANSHQCSGMQRMMRRGAKPVKRFNFLKTIEEICETKGFSPAEALITVFNRANEAAAEFGDSPQWRLAALKLQGEMAKVVFNKAYADKKEVSGPDGGAIPMNLTIDQIREIAERMNDEV